MSVLIVVIRTLSQLKRIMRVALVASLATLCRRNRCLSTMWETSAQLSSSRQRSDRHTCTEGVEGIVDSKISRGDVVFFLLAAQ
jgi:hypothetical protein